MDENLPRRLVRLLAPEVRAETVGQRGWSGKRNGELLALAQDEFDAFLTMDRGIEHQQNLGGLGLAVVLLRAKSNSIEDVAPLVGDVKAALKGVQAGALYEVRGG